MAGMVVEDLSEEEKYLFAILSDPSGLDIAEFCWTDETQRHDLLNDKGERDKEDCEGSFCWRARPYQWAWFRCKDRQQIDQCARSVGKSLSIQLRGFAFPFIHPDEEMVVTAPELNHLEPITDLIETRFRKVRLGQEMMMGGRSGITHRPFKMNFRNGARIMGRIPQKDGKGVKGIHPIWLELDEAQDYPHPGWIELNETLNFGKEGAVWRAHGVTKGIRDDFFEYTQNGSGWKVHRFTAMHRPPPFWSDEERESKIKLYHGADSGDYRRNIFGEHGDSTSPIFNLFRLMACVDDNQESNYNQDEYVHYEIIDSWLRQAQTTIDQELDLPLYHVEKYRKNQREWPTFWVGVDLGWTNHPTEIVVFVEEVMSAEEYKHQKGNRDLGRGKAVPAQRETTRLKLLTRITLTRIAYPDQKRAFLKVIEHYRPKAFAFDATGAGQPVFQEIMDIIETDPQYDYIKTIVKGYNFSGNILVAFDDTIEVSEWATKEEYIKEAGMKRNAVDYATDQLRILIDSGRFWLPWDVDLTNEFGGQTYKVASALNQWGRREYSLGKFHALDACRMMALGWSQYAIEEFVKGDPDEPIIDLFGLG